MSSQQKRGFRLPWAAERDSEEAPVAAAVDDGALDSAPAAVGIDPGEGGGPAAEATPAMTTDAAPAAADLPDVTAEAEMIETDSLQGRIERVAADEAWPATGQAAEKEADDSAGAAGTTSIAESPRSARRENPLVAGLVKAMREAAVASRAETTTRLQAEATARIETIRAEATEEAATLRKRVDEDIAGIREWSKIEMARIRAETEHRIEERRADAIAENQRHLDGIEQLVEQVQATVTRFESDMDRFFDQLLAESDPARLAALAEQAPEPPDLSGDLPKPVGWTTRSAEPTSDGDAIDERADERASLAEPEPAAVADDEVVDAEATGSELNGAEPLEAAAAAEAEAAATEGLDLSSGDAWPAAVMAAARQADDDAAATDADGSTSRLNVSGLTSVAGISAFKGAIGGLPGVRSVSVSTGERGVFIFTVNHAPETDLAAAISDLSAFAIQVTDDSADGLSVTATETAAA